MSYTIKFHLLRLLWCQQAGKPGKAGKVAFWRPISTCRMAYLVLHEFIHYTIVTKGSNINGPRPPKGCQRLGGRLHVSFDFFLLYGPLAKDRGHGCVCGAH